MAGPLHPLRLTRPVPALALLLFLIGACATGSSEEAVPSEGARAGTSDTVARDEGILWTAEDAARFAGIAAAGAAEAQKAAADAATPFDSARAWDHLVKQVELGPRPSGSAALEATRRYIIDQLQAARIGTRQQAFIAETPAGQVPMINVVATIPGRRPGRIILASHIDTKRAPFRFVGANDGASSTAVLIELGRVLAGAQPEYTIELLFLDGEEAVNWDWGVTGEDNTYGSRHYVEMARRTQTLDGIAAFVLLDMIGEPNPRILREASSTPWLVDIIWNAADRLGHGSVFLDEVTQVDDDHVSFLRAGVPAVDLIDLDYPQWHTEDDDLEHVSARSLQIVGDVVLAALPEIARYAAR